MRAWLKAWWHGPVTQPEPVEQDGPIDVTAALAECRRRHSDDADVTAVCDGLEAAMEALKGRFAPSLVAAEASPAVTTRIRPDWRIEPPERPLQRPMTGAERMQRHRALKRQRQGKA